MIWTLFSASPLLGLLWVVAIVLSLSVHEFSHALAAKALGDDTAEQAGRLSLNPLVHIDLFGLLSMFLLGFGWARPVPFNPSRLAHPVWDQVKIALAGPSANIIFAAAAALAFRAVSGAAAETWLPVFLVLVALLNLSLLFFNLIPLPPLDGSSVLLALLDRPGFESAHRWMVARGPQILLILVGLSLFTSFQVFSFVFFAASGACDQLLGTSCFGTLAGLLY